MDRIDSEEAKREFERLIDRVSKGAQIGITRNGKLAAVVVPVSSKVKLNEAFDAIEQRRKRVWRPHSNLKKLIEYGRM